MITTLTQVKYCDLETTASLLMQAPPPDDVTTYKQRYFVCDKFWHKESLLGSKKGPIFFYLGNEADVTL